MKPNNVNQPLCIAKLRAAALAVDEGRNEDALEYVEAAAHMLVAQVYGMTVEPGEPLLFATYLWNTSTVTPGRADVTPKRIETRIMREVGTWPEQSEKVNDYLTRGTFKAHGARTWYNQFRDFVMGFEIPADWQDDSWGNDTCPSFLVEDGELKVWVDWLMPKDREMGPDVPRFNVTRAGDESDANAEALFACDEPHELLDWLASRKRNGVS